MTWHPRTILRRSVTEADWSRVVKRTAERKGWHGIHIRQSEGNLEGIHTLRNSDHSDAHGFPDWIFVSTARGLILFAELKSEVGRLSPHQKRWHAWLAPPKRVEVRVLRPSDYEELVQMLEAA